MFDYREFYSIMVNMRKFYRFFKVFLVFIAAGLLINACATQARPVEEVIPPVPETVTAPETIIAPVRVPPPVEIPSFIEQLRARVKRNGGDVGKYFVLDDNGRILLMAAFSDNGSEYEVRYNLENARTLSRNALGDYSYEIGFSVLQKSPDNTESIVLEDTLIWTPLSGGEGILLAFDDDYMERWEQYLDLLDKYKCKVTFFIQGAPDVPAGGSSQAGLSGNASAPGQLNIAQFCKEALDRGHDIGFHTINHLDLRRVSRETFLAETVEPLELYRQEGIPVSSLAYPFGFSESWMHEILLDYYSVVRGYGTTFRIYDEDSVRGGHIIARAIDNTVIKGEDNFKKTIMSMLMTVKFLNDRRILPLTTHDIYDEADWGISVSRLEFLLGTVSDLKLNFFLYSDFAAEVKE